MPAFLREVNRVLKADGRFAFADFRPPAGVSPLEAQFADAGFDVVGQRDVTGEVLCALDRMTQQRQILSCAVPRIFRGAFRHFAGVRDSIPYRMFQDGRLKYLIYQLSKGNTVPVA